MWTSCWFFLQVIFSSLDRTHSVHIRIRDDVSIRSGFNHTASLYISRYCGWVPITSQQVTAAVSLSQKGQQHRSDRHSGQGASRRFTFASQGYTNCAGAAFIFPMAWLVPFVTCNCLEDAVACAEQIREYGDLQRRGQRLHVQES